MPGKVVPLISIENGIYKIEKEGEDYLKKLKKDCSVIAFTGEMFSGKVSLVDELFQNSKQTVEDISTLQETPLHEKSVETMTAVNIYCDDNDHIILGVNKHESELDHHMFTLAMLVASTLVYISSGDEESHLIDSLEPIRQLSKYVKIQMNQDEEDVEAVLGKYTPSFHWIICDLLKFPSENGRKLSPQEYLDHLLQPQAGFSDGIQQRNMRRAYLTNFFPKRNASLLNKIKSEGVNSEFKKQLDKIKKKIYAASGIKTIQGYPINGGVVLRLIKEFLTFFNEKKPAVVAKSWTKVVQLQMEDALTLAIQEYDGEWKRLMDQVEMENQQSLGHRILSPAQLKLIQEQAVVHAKHILLTEGINHEELIAPHKVLLLEKIDKTYAVAIQKNHEASEAYAQDVIMSFHNDTLAKCNDSFSKCSGASCASVFETTLLSYKEDLQTMFTRYKEQCQEPKASQVLTKFLSNEVLNVVIDWGVVLSKQFEIHWNSIQTQMQDTLAHYVECEEKEKVISSGNEEQKALNEAALVEASSRLAEERHRMREDIENKKNEVERLMAYLDQMRISHKETVSRQDALLKETRERILELQQHSEAERNKRDADVKHVNRELLETERGFHQEEKSLMKEHHGLLAQVVDLERQIAESKTLHIQETFRIQQDSKLQMEERKKSLEEEIRVLKSRAKEDIGALRKAHEKKMFALKEKIRLVDEETATAKEAYDNVTKSLTQEANLCKTS